MSDKRTRSLHDDVGVRQQQRRRALARAQLVDDLDDIVPLPRTGQITLDDPDRLAIQIDYPAIQIENQAQLSPYFDDLCDEDDDDDFHSCISLNHSLDDSISEVSDDFDDMFLPQQRELITEEEQREFQRDLAFWVLSCNVTKSAVDALLRVLRSQPRLSFLPKSYRTLIKTPRSINLIPMSPGKYFHAGLKEGIINALENSGVNIDSLDKVQVFLNVDGASMSDSSPSHLWFILGRFINVVNSSPFEIGLYHGPGKPNNFNEFLRQFTEEANQLIDHGFEYHDKTITVELHCFTCDAPALANIKFIKQHGAYSSCTKCTTEGFWVDNTNGGGGRVTFPEVNAPLRTHQSFVDQEQLQHHGGKSILENLRNINMVNSFTIDPFHLVYIGVVGKMLHLLNSCRRKITVRVLKSEVDNISNFLVEIKNCIPLEFARKTRSLKQLAQYKATEFRLLLLYVLPVVLCLLPHQIYDHFLLLHCGIRILCCPQLVKNPANVQFARTLLVNFVTSSKSLYGEAFLVYNVHNLIHLADEVLRFGPLDVFSCAPFENQIGILTRLVRPTNRALSQLAKRIMERRNHNFTKPINHPNGMFHQHNNGPTPIRFSGRQFSKLYYKKMRLTVQRPNNCVILHNGDVFEISNFLQTNNGEQMMYGRVLSPIRSLFLYPMDSKILGIVVVNSSLCELQCVPIDCLSKKAIKIPIPNNTTDFAIVPFLHDS